MDKKPSFKFNFQLMSKMNLFDIANIDENQKVQLQLQLMKERLKSYNKSISEVEEEFWEYVMIISNISKEFWRPIKVVAPLGSGKSTALNAWHIYHGLYTKDNLFGSIVVKSSIEDCNEFVDEVNKASGRQIAYAVFGKSHYLEQGKTQGTEWEQADRFPTIVLTHAMLSSLTQRDKLMDLASWVDENGATRRRTTLFIDERPQFSDSFTLTSTDIERLNSIVQSLANQDDIERYYYKDFEDNTSRLVQELRRPQQARSRKLKSNFLRYKIPEQLQNQWDRSQAQTGSDYQLLEKFIHIANHGGVIEVGPGGASVTAGYDIWKRIGWFNVIVFDATGSLDPNYPTNLEDLKGQLGISFIDFDLPVQNEHQNLTINYSSKHNFGKNFLYQGNNPEVRYNKVKKLVNHIAGKHESLLVIGHNHLIDRLNADDEISANAIIVSFGRAKGTNDYRDCDGLLILGNIIKSGAHYYVNTELRNPGQVVEPGGSSQGGFQMIDPLAQEYYVKDRAIDLQQIIGRIRTRKSEIKKAVYMFSMEKAIVDHVAAHFSGCTVKEWELPFSLTSEEETKTAKDYFIDWLKEFAESDQLQVKAKEVYEEKLGITRMQYSRIKKDSDVLNAMKELGVEFKGQSIVKK